MNLNKFIKDDKRKSPRIDVSIPCSINYENELIIGKIINISENGAKIIIDKKFLENDLCSLSFKLNLSDFNLNCKIIKKENEIIYINFIEVDKKLNELLYIIDIGENLE